MMMVRGFIFIRVFIIILSGIFLITLANAQETKPVYRAFYPHQIAETTINEEIISEAVKNGFITYHTDSGIAKIFLPKDIKTSDKFRSWFMGQVEQATVGNTKAQTLINNIISDHLTGGYKAFGEG